MTFNDQPDRRLFVLFPAIAMLLGWGLRGYIGGGPYGALMPGCFVALTITLLLGYRMETAAVAALFGAVGIGYGGNMTYGQTLGFLREPDTVYWGLLGCLVKGTVWGLLGGLVLGLGLARDRIKRSVLCGAFVAGFFAYFVGLFLINEPKLIYFSDPVNKPRDESWSGLLFAAFGIAAYLQARGGNRVLALPLRFAFWGAVGGGIGFGGGGLWMVVGPHLPLPQAWIGWWKVMEFFFGFALGAALGLCAWLNRTELKHAGQRGETPALFWPPCVGFIVYVAALFGGYASLDAYAPDVLDNVVFQVAFGYILFASATIIFGLHSLQAAWQAAITMAFFHTVIDYTRDLNSPDKFGYSASVPVQVLILVVSCTVVGYLVNRFQQGEKAVPRLFLLAIWSCYVISCVRSFLYAQYLSPPAGEGRIGLLLSEKPTIIFVHGTFTLAALYCTWVVWKRFMGASTDRRSATAD